MTQARIVLRDTVLERGKRLMEVTQIASLTELVSLMFSRYGKHLEQTWEVQPLSPTFAAAEPPPMPQRQSIATSDSESDFVFDQPITGL
ncbi:MAG: hypothetical protein F6K16_31210 [Symploca sp. SIO2B6]|nr:hypothetical protein [Symploca sp. SIO2B6]